MRILEFATVCKGRVKHNKWVGKDLLRKRGFVKLIEKLFFTEDGDHYQGSQLVQIQKTIDRVATICSMTSTPEGWGVFQKTRERRPERLLQDGVF